MSPVASPNASVGGNPLPVPAVQIDRPTRLAEQTLTVEPLELGQTFTGVGSLAEHLFAERWNDAVCAHESTAFLPAG